MDDWIVQIENEQRIVKEQKVKKNTQGSANSLEDGPYFRGIFRIPSDVLQEQEDRSVFSPLKTSFGPYHHGTPSCQPRERHKELCLPHFLNRIGKTLKNIIDDLKPRVDELRQMYHTLDSNWENDDAFLRTMILDGCYLLQIMLEESECRCDCDSDDDCCCDGIIRKSALFDPKETDTYRRDMLLLENQIPLKVLMVLYPAKHGRGTYRSLEQLMRGFFFGTRRHSSFSVWIKGLHLLDVYILALQINIGSFPMMGEHCLEVICGELLCTQLCGELCCGGCCGNLICGVICDNIICDLLCGGLVCSIVCSRLCCCPMCDADEVSDNIRELNEMINRNSLYRHFKIPSATKLEEADIEIKPNESAFLIWLEQSTLMLPEVYVNDTTTSIFHNLVLFERFSASSQRHAMANIFSSYVIFMNGLLRGAADSKLLQSKGIINTTEPITEDDHVGKLFSGLRKNIPPSSSLVGMHKIAKESLGKQYKKNLSPWRKDLFKNYLKSPWAVISIIAALLLFILTIIQTVYTVFGYYKNPK